MASRSTVLDPVDASFSEIWKEVFEANVIPFGDEQFFFRDTLGQNETDVYRDEKIFNSGNNSLDWNDWTGNETSLPASHSFTEKQEDVTPVFLERRFDVTRQMLDFTPNVQRKVAQRLERISEWWAYIVHTYMYEKIADNASKYGQSANDYHMNSSTFKTDGSDSSVTSGDALTQAAVSTLYTDMEERKVPVLNTNMFASDRVSTQGVGQGYALICTPGVFKTVDDFSDFITPVEYANENVGAPFDVDSLVKWEKGAIPSAYTRVLYDQYALYKPDAGSSVDVHYPLYVGPDFGKLVLFEGYSDGFERGIPMPTTGEVEDDGNDKDDPLGKIAQVFAFELGLVADINNNQSLSVVHVADDDNSQDTSSTRTYDTEISPTTVD